jgi:hypothetical protein
LKWRQNYNFSTIIISNSQIETLVSYSSSTNVNVHMSFPNSNFEGNFSTYVFGKSFWHYRKLKIDCWTSRHRLCEKILNAFVCLEVRILVEKWNVYDGHIFWRPLLKTCILETTSLCLHTGIIVKVNFLTLIIFFQINVKVCLLCVYHVMTSIILHTRRHNSIKSLLRTWFLCFSWFCFFAFWIAEEHVFHIVPFRPMRNVLKGFKCLGVLNRLRTEIK